MLTEGGPFHVFSLSLQQALHGVEKLNFRQKLCSPGIIPLVKVGESFELGWVAAAVETLQGRKQKYMNPQLKKKSI